MTQNQTILKHLKTRKRGITSWQAIEKYHITRLAARINDLRDNGLRIADTWESGIRHNRKVRWKRYFLLT